MTIIPTRFRLARAAAPNLALACLFAVAGAFCMDVGPPLTQAAPEPAVCAEPVDARVDRVEIDFNYDGVVDNVRTYRYTTAGLLVQVDEDYENDGVVDASVWYEYDVLGRLAAEYHDGGQEPPDGRFDFVQRTTYVVPAP